MRESLSSTQQHIGTNGVLKTAEQTEQILTEKYEQTMRQLNDTECSVCGRQLRVHIEHLGQTVACKHCGSDFLATNPASNLHTTCSVLEKANQLLDRLSTIKPA